MAAPAKKRAGAAGSKPPLADPPKNLTFDEIMAAEDCQEVTIKVPEWGGTVTLKQYLREQQVDAEIAATVDGEINAPLLQLYQLSAALVDPVVSFDQIGAFTQKNAVVVARLVGYVLMLQGGGAEAIKAYDKSILA